MVSSADNGCHGAQPSPNYPPISRRVRATDTPVIAFTRRMTAMRSDCLSLGQGIVYWRVVRLPDVCPNCHWDTQPTVLPLGMLPCRSPPPESLELAAQIAQQPAISVYGPNEGYPPLRAALREKLELENGLKNVSRGTRGDEGVAVKEEWESCAWAL